MKVALLTPAYFPEVHRGGERVVRELAEGLVRDGHAVSIVTGHRGRPSSASEAGVRVLRVPRLAEGTLRRRAFTEYLGHLPAATLALRHVEPDIAHAHYPTDALVAARWGRARGRPSVFSYHGIPQREMLSSRRLSLRVVDDAVTQAGAVVVSSHAAAAAARRWLGVEPRVIHPPVDLAAFAGEVRRDARPTIVCAADPDDDRKRVVLLATAFGLLRAREPQMRLRLLRPRDPARLAQLTAPGVEFFDPVARPEDLGAIYRTAWVSALAAYNEAFGLVLAEALAAGTPVVGARDGGVPEIVDRDAVGRLFDGDDPHAVARALSETLDLARRPGTAEACRERAEAFSAGRFVAAHEALYAELLG
ncbi:MAG: glycosyl transferase group 1 [Solirubrobacteraceae bacterium]|nr:glycosyl transferase group 1 [Solirubrobacteraceae bacterium]